MYRSQMCTILSIYSCKKTVACLTNSKLRVILTSNSSLKNCRKTITALAIVIRWDNKKTTQRTGAVRSRWQVQDDYFPDWLHLVGLAWALPGERVRRWHALLVIAVSHTPRTTVTALVSVPRMAAWHWIVALHWQESLWCLQLYRLRLRSLRVQLIALVNLHQLDFALHEIVRCYL